MKLLLLGCNMVVEVCVFVLGELVFEVIVVIWFKKLGDMVVVDEMLCELEIDKVMVEVLFFVVGKLVEIVVFEGEMVMLNVLFVQIVEQGNVGFEEMLFKVEMGVEFQEG